MQANQRRRRCGLLLLACAVVAAGVLVLGLPRVLAQRVATPAGAGGLTPDAVNYVGAAYNWVEGAGMGAPVVFSYYLPGLRPPAPAVVVHGPVVSALFALPLALGSGLSGLWLIHVSWAAAIAAGAVVFARRWLPLPSALAFGIALGWSYGWVVVTQQLLTEVTAVAMIGVVLAATPAGMRTVAGAIGLAALTLGAWLTRPNLGVLLPAVAGAAVLELGLRGAVRSRPLWAYVIGFAALQRAVSWGVEASVGWSPYAHYGLMVEILSAKAATLYQTEYVGLLDFLARRGDAVLCVLRGNLDLYVRYVFLHPNYHHIGWLALPAVVYGLGRSNPHGRLPLRATALAGTGLTATALCVTAGFDPLRYPLPGAACLWLLALAMTDTLFAALGRKLPAATPRVLRRALRLAPLALVLVVFAVQSAPAMLRQSQRFLEVWQHGVPRAARGWRAVAPALCPAIDRDALVAATDPYGVYLFCGNAGFVLPPDLADEVWLVRYLDDVEPGYVISDGSARFAHFERSSRLRRIRSEGTWAVYEVVGAGPRSRPWRAPPPLVGAQLAEPGRARSR